MTETIHDTLLDRMPDVAGGVAAWTADEAAHLAACAECREAWALLDGARTLGATIEASFDGGAAAREVTARLREAGRRGRSLRRWMVGLAAAAAVVLYAAVRPDRGPAVTGAPVAEARFFPELDSLSTEELAVVAEEVDRPASELDPVAGQQLFDLDTTQLERVLRSLEG